MKKNIVKGWQSFFFFFVSIKALITQVNYHKE